MSKKETGEIPVRARRRKVQKSLFLLFAAKRGQAIEEKIFEKAKNDSAAVEIFFRQMPFKKRCERQRER